MYLYLRFSRSTGLGGGGTLKVNFVSSLPLPSLEAVVCSVSSIDNIVISPTSALSKSWILNLKLYKGGSY